MVNFSNKSWDEINLNPYFWSVQFQHLAILLLDSNLIYSIFSLLFSELGFPGDSFIGFPQYSDVNL